MKKKCFILVFLMLCTCFSFGQITTSPSTVLADQAATITFNKTGTGLAAYTGIIYAYIGVTVNGVRFQNIKGSPVFTSPLHPQMTQVSSSTYSLSITPDLYTYFGVATTNSITEFVWFLDLQTLLLKRLIILFLSGLFNTLYLLHY